MSDCPFLQALAPEHRADPYSLFAAMPAAPTRLPDGRYLATRYEDVVALLHDPRMSSTPGETSAGRLDLLKLDPPEHDRLRRIVMRQFGPPHRPEFVASLEPEIRRVADALLDALADRREAEIVTDYAHRLPLTMICRIMGVPPEDESTFHDWVEAIADSTGAGEKRPEAARAASGHLRDYLAGLAANRRGRDGEDLLSRLLNDDGPEGALPERSLGPMAVLLLVAGHETTVNLIANGILALLRDLGLTSRLKSSPELAITLIEELLRHQPPVQFVVRTALADVPLRDVVIPAGSRTVLLLAQANRDAARFTEPDALRADRRDNAHLGFGSGIHACFGAPLARLEGQIALCCFARRVRDPRLLAAPEWRPSPLLRGPSTLRVGHDGIDPV